MKEGFQRRKISVASVQFRIIRHWDLRTIYEMGNSRGGEIEALMKRTTFFKGFKA
jgi:hypothetical protein